LHLVGYLYYWQMGFNSVFKGLIHIISEKIIGKKCVNYNLYYIISSTTFV